MTLKTYIARRLILIVPTFFMITVLVFTLIHIAPGDPAIAMVGRHGLSKEILEKLRTDYGLDQPIPVQYLIWVSKVVQGDLGYSYVSKRPVITMIGERVPYTLELMLAAEFISIAIAVVLGVIAAVKHYSLADAVASVGALVGYSIPTFWVALVGLLVFSFHLGWLPLSGVITPTEFPSPVHAFYDHLTHLVLPAGVLVLGWTAYLFRMVRSSMLEVLRQDYITTARAKGLRERIVIYKHALRNAMLPVVTYLGYSMGFLLSGAAVIEYIFAWPGLGDFLVTIANVRDYPTMMGAGSIIAIMVLLANLCADIAYAVVDPRIRYD
jgi:peptide/nickel transport system permease protein